MNRLFLTAGVAALAIATSATAGPGGHGGGPGADRQAAQQQPRGGGGAQRIQRAPSFQAPMQRQAVARPQRVERVAMAPPAAMERIQTRAQRPTAIDRQARIADRQQARAMRVQQQAPARMVQSQPQARVDRTAQIQNRAAQRQALQTNRAAARQQVQANRSIAMQDRLAARQQVQANAALATQGRVAARQQVQANRVAATQNMVAMRSAATTQRLDPVRAFTPVPMALAPQSTRVMPVGQAVTYVGQPLSALGNALALSAIPDSASYLYPDTPQYYYQYGNGYAYQIDRGSSLISALIPLLAGGYMPGQYLPTSYMSSYVPNYYGLSSFYPDSPYSCNRYGDGVVYQVDCATGLIENVIPLYASGYGVGQMLPSSYDYYNLPYQYRSIYPASASTGYYYAPGAIYQYDPTSSMITSVASLLSPGFSVGQQLPMGYSAYNVPYAYRQTYYDTPDAWYRYNNGYIYQVDPTTQLVSAVVASILT